MMFNINTVIDISTVAARPTYKDIFYSNIKVCSNKCIRKIVGEKKADKKKK